MYAVDEGANEKFVVWSEHGEVTNLPKGTRGLNPAQKKAQVIAYLLNMDDVVIESPSIGASGIEPLHIADVVKNSNHKLYVISARAVKNAAKDDGLSNADLTDKDSARYIYEIAEERKGNLRKWVFSEEKFHRINTSVRPYDKRDYKDPKVDEYLSLLVPFNNLPENLRLLFGNRLKKNYAPSRMLPFAMAFDETGSTSRVGYEKIIGLYSDGYPSFYRHATIVLMQRVAKDEFVKRYGFTGNGKNGKPVNSDITPIFRKEAWKITRKAIRTLYAMSK